MVEHSSNPESYRGGTASRPIKTPLNFILERESGGSKARAATFQTLHGEVRTPIFMPVGTQGTVKGQTVDSLRTTGTRLILANTYHLLLRPGPEVFKKCGGIHRFMNWEDPVLTDSGGFQIFSLPHSSEMNEDGAPVFNVMWMENFADAEKIPFIIRDDGHKHGTTETLLRSQGYKINIVMRYESPEAIKTAVSKKLGVGILYREVVKEDVARGLFKQLHVRGVKLEANTYIVYHKQHPLSSTGEAFLKLLRKWRDGELSKRHDQRINCIS